jgi:hypothetical protein
MVVWSQLYFGYYVSARMFDAGGSASGGGDPTIAVGREPQLAYNPGDREFGMLYSGGDVSDSHVTAARVRVDGSVVSTATLGPGSTEGAGFAFDSRERSYLASWRSGGFGGSFIAADLTPIAPAHYAAGYVIAYNPAADQYLLVRSPCNQPGGLASVCGRRVGNPPVAADRTGPKLGLTVRRLQRIVRQRGLVLRAKCDEACAVRASAWITLSGASRAVKLRRVRKSLTSNAETKLRLKATKRTLRKLRRAFKRRHRLVVGLTVSANDSAGNRTIAKRKLRARR